MRSWNIEEDSTRGRSDAEKKGPSGIKAGEERLLYQQNVSFLGGRSFTGKAFEGGKKVKRTTWRKKPTTTACKAATIKRKSGYKDHRRLTNDHPGFQKVKPGLGGKATFSAGLQANSVGNRGGKREVR